ncbi:MAG: DUF2892 domain-containing protein [Rhodoferax sp.]|nr:DUF2892 domain-containing protein [Rhodoferax sp.]
MANLNTWDRMVRALLGLVALELAFFWLAGGLQIAAYVVGAVLLVTVLVRFCPLYRVLGISTLSRDGKGMGKAMGAVAVVLLATLLAGGSYASIFFTRKLFIEDFNVMNNFYKQTLFLTGKNEREKAVANYENLIPSFQKFQEKYTTYHPYALKGDTKLGPDLVQVAGMISGVNDLVRTGDLHQAHLALEKVRPVFQDIFKRNGFSMLAVALVDFHDEMELMLDAANAKDSAKLVALYPQVSEKLKAVEAETNDAEIQAIRKNLDDLLGLAKAAQTDQLPAKGDALKSSFVKVYLQRG